MVDANGDLQLTYTDGNTVNAGSVIGPQGDQGPRGARGEVGPSGLDGEDGANVISAVLDGDGAWSLRSSNNESIRTAPVVGAVRPGKGRDIAQSDQGDQGDEGPRVSVVNAILNADGELVLSLDNESITVGNVVETGEEADGEQGLKVPGRWDTVATAAVNANNELILTLTDGTEINAGCYWVHKVRPGEKGETGEKVRPVSLVSLSNKPQ